jgi:RNA polymerase sigma-70 factor, ECF subfamily
MPSRGFDEAVLPHLDAAFNYARWLTRNNAEAEDVVQDACVRAIRFLGSLRDDDARPWLLAIVRNTWYSRLDRRAVETHSIPMSDAMNEPPDPALDPEALLLQQDAARQVHDVLDELPVDFREVLVLRELKAFRIRKSRP